MRSFFQLAAIALVATFLAPLAQGATDPGSRLEIEWPERRLWLDADGVEGIVLRALDAHDQRLALDGIVGLTGLGVQGPVNMVGGEVRLPAARIESSTVGVEVGELSLSTEVPQVSPWLSLLPAVLAIALALVTRQVLLSLAGGIYVGALILGSDPLRAGAAMFDRMVGEVADADHVKITMFTLLMGGMVGVITASGGTTGIVNALTRFAKTPKSALLASWGMGMLIFFDDIASSLLVGNTMRPVTDRLKVSREKLAYVVDSTAAPISSLALVSTWIGYEVSVLASAMAASGIERDAYEVFISGMPSRFYQILSLGFVVMIATSGRDFGPMLTAERRARKGDGVLREGAKPLMDANVLEGSASDEHSAPPRAWLAVAPIAALIGVSLAVLMITGLEAAASDPIAYEQARSAGFVRAFGFVLGNSASYDALLYGAGSGVAAAIILARSVKALELGPAFDALTRGIQAMMMAVMVLTLAWSIGSVMEDLHAGQFVSSALSGTLPFWTLPALSFMAAALIAVATGTSWATMAVLFPIVMPLVAAGAAHPNFESVFLATSSAILGGAVFGDHCSPISDTTVLSSIACASDHVDHTRTQAPYALTVGLVTIALGYIPAGLGMSPWISLILSIALLAAIVRYFGSYSESEEAAADAATPLGAEA